jgi:hypothetical protein
MSSVDDRSSNYNNMQWNKIKNNDSLIDELRKGIPHIPYRISGSL